MSKNQTIDGVIEVKFLPFPIPAQVQTTAPGASRYYYLAELSPEVLQALCDQFAADVFKSAGKQPPGTIYPGS